MKTIDSSNYKDEKLTELCQQEGCARLPYESDWALRKRTYVAIFRNNPFVATEILFGAKNETLTETDKMMSLCLFVGVKNPFNIGDDELQKYVNGFKVDPLALREGRENNKEENEVVAVDYKTLSKEEFKNRLEAIIRSSRSKRQIKDRLRSELLYGLPYAVSIYYGTLPQTNSILSATGVKVNTTMLFHPEGNFAVGW